MVGSRPVGGDCWAGEIVVRPMGSRASGARDGYRVDQAAGCGSVPRLYHAGTTIGGQQRRLVTLRDQAEQRLVHTFMQVRGLNSLVRGPLCDLVREPYTRFRKPMLYPLSYEG